MHMLSLEQRLAFVADDWNYEPKELIGEIVDIQEWSNQFAKENAPEEDRTKPVIDLLTEPKTLTGYRVYCSPTGLRNEIRKLAPHVGDRLAIRYLGQKTRPDGTKPHMFKVLLERDGEASE